MRQKVCATFTLDRTFICIIKYSNSIVLNAGMCGNVIETGGLLCSILVYGWSKYFILLIMQIVSHRKQIGHAHIIMYV